MKKLLIIFIISTGFICVQSDSFYFPEKFYTVDFPYATVKSIKSIFGRHCKIKNSTRYVTYTDGPCIQSHYKTIVYEAEKLSFFFHPDLENKYYYLSSIKIDTGSPFTFGKTNMKIGKSSISDVLNEYGNPQEMKWTSTEDSIYTYHSNTTKRDYSFWFNENCKILSSVEIEYTRD